MGETINLSANIKENLEKKKEKYPNLAEFHYDENTDSLIYNGQSFSPAGYALSHTAPVFFQMVPQDIFDYLKNGLYFQSPNEIAKIKSMITNELIITEEEENQLKLFVKQYIKRLEIYINNKILFDNGIKNIDLNNFINNLLERRQVINGVRTGIYPNSVAANIITQEYNKITSELNDNLPTQTNETNDLQQTMSLTRKKTGTYIFPEQEDIDRKVAKEQHLGMAGFTSIVLIISAAVTFGMYLALKLL